MSNGGVSYYSELGDKSSFIGLLFKASSYPQKRRCHTFGWTQNVSSLLIYLFTKFRWGQIVAIP